MLSKGIVAVAEKKENPVPSKNTIIQGEKKKGRQ